MPHINAIIRFTIREAHMARHKRNQNGCNGRRDTQHTHHTHRSSFVMMGCLIFNNNLAGPIIFLISYSKFMPAIRRSQHVYLCTDEHFERRWRGARGFAFHTSSVIISPIASSNKFKCDFSVGGAAKTTQQSTKSRVCIFVCAIRCYYHH